MQKNLHLQRRVPDRHHPHRLTTKNILKNSGKFLDAKKRPSTHHDLPRNPPQLHHKNTTTKHPVSQKPPEKTPLRHTTKKMRPGKKPNRILRKLTQNRLIRQRE
jgi:hypothetical protein